MKNRIVIGICVTLLASAAGLYAIVKADGRGGKNGASNWFLVSQGPGKREHPLPGPMGGLPFAGPMMGHMAEQLELTDQQKTQIKSIFDNERTTVDPLVGQMDQIRQQLRAATKNGQFDEAQVRALAAQQAQIMTEMIVERERAKSKMYQVLTPQQREKADQMMENFETRRQGFRPRPDGSQ